METHIHNAATMHALGTKLVQKADKFLLYGALGSGKTTLVQGIAAALGIDPGQVNSPTYTYLHVYEEQLLHIDMRRITSQTQRTALGIIELIDRYPSVAIERPKWEASYADPSRLTISITQNNSERLVTYDQRGI